MCLTTANARSRSDSRDRPFASPAAVGRRKRLRKHEDDDHDEENGRCE